MALRVNGDLLSSLFLPTNGILMGLHGSGLFQGCMDSCYLWFIVQYYRELCSSVPQVYNKFDSVSYESWCGVAIFWTERTDKWQIYHILCHNDILLSNSTRSVGAHVFEVGTELYLYCTIRNRVILNTKQKYLQWISLAAQTITTFRFL